jgi:putative ABC transport system permease protein
MGLQMIVVSGIVGILMIFGIMFYTVRERTREIGVLKALGFSNADVLRQFMLEGLYFGFLGGLIGIALGAATYSFLGPALLDTEANVTLEISYLAIGLAAAALVGALGSAYPAWMASRISPMEALRHE